MWISIERDSVRQVLRSPHCGVLSYLLDTTELIDCKYLNIVSYPVPGDPTATALSSSSISLSWTNTSSIYGISIERRTASTEFAEIARGTAGETSYTDEGLDPATQYFYRLRYFNGLEAYHPSGEDDATTEAGAVKYGRLYNWYAATDIRGIAAEGWHLPTLEEAQTLIDYHGGNEIAGTKMRETGSVYWDSEAEGFIEGTNDYGFNIRGAGLRQFFMSGEFIGLRINTAMWLNGYAAMGFLVNADMVYIDIIVGDDSKKSGAPIRPIKDSTTLSHGETGTYTGNDGKVYRTICIGTQEWLADNLAETKFRNGDDIPIVTDNATWAALETAGMCSYNNDDNNI